MAEVIDFPRQGRLNFPGEIRAYVLGGNSTLTIRSRKSGVRFTYKVKSVTKDRDKNWSTGNQDRTKYFVSVMVGPDNAEDFRYMGMMDRNLDGQYRFHPTRGSKIGANAPSFIAFVWFWNQLEFKFKVSDGIEFWHEGSCCVCGRKLTVPESVADGIGPECRSKVGAA